MKKIFFITNANFNSVCEKIISLSKIKKIKIKVEKIRKLVREEKNKIKGRKIQLIIKNYD